MAGKKLFRGAFFGFRRKDVNSYIERFLKEQSAKNREITAGLEEEKKKTAELAAKYDELFRQFESMTQRAEVLNSENDRLSSTVSMLYGDIADKSAKISAYEQEIAQLKSEARVSYGESRILCSKPAEQTEPAEKSFDRGAPDTQAHSYEESAPSEDESSNAEKSGKEIDERGNAEYEFMSAPEEKADKLKQAPAEAEETQQEKPLSEATSDALNRFRALLDPANRKKQENDENTKGDWRDFFFR